MKNVENELKELILDRYGNLSEFCKKIDLPWTTLDSILKRGVDKANIRNILKITSELGIDVERLASGEIVYKEDES
jgi:predicted transcriptional regulator